jgi:hypothetical protein
MLLSGSLLACSSFTPSDPPLSDSTMVEVMTELHLAKARANTYGDTLYTALRDSILRQHSVSDARFDDALRYYSERPSEYLAIHRAMEDSLEAGRQRLLED